MRSSSVFISVMLLLVINFNILLTYGLTNALTLRDHSFISTVNGPEPSHGTVAKLVECDLIQG